MDKKVELQVLNLTRSQAEANAFAMVLGEVNGERQLPIIIGAGEAQSIALHLKGVKYPRPLTHDLFVSCLTSFSITLTEILIYRAEEGVFYSHLYLKKGEEMIKADSRTSDAVGLAIRMQCPIYIYESILEKECLVSTELNAETEEEKKNLEEETVQSLKKALAKAIENENYELASVLRDEILRRK
jgi:uncharacterized protein